MLSAAAWLILSGMLQTLRLSGSIALATNGSQTDPIIEKIAMGMPVRDAMALVLLAMDYEKDTLCTPRICAAVDASKKIATLGIVRRDAVLVREFELAPGKIFYVSTYEKNAPCKHNLDEGFNVEHADDICEYMIATTKLKVSSVSEMMTKRAVLRSPSVSSSISS